MKKLALMMPTLSLSLILLIQQQIDGDTCDSNSAIIQEVTSRLK